MEGVTEAERQTGIPKTTIQEWVNRPEFVQLRSEKKEVVGEMMWAGVQIGVKEVVKGLEGEAKLSEKAIALGVLYDKFALLTGTATSRTESLTGDIEDADRIKAKEVIRKATRELAG